MKFYYDLNMRRTDTTCELFPDGILFQTRVFDHEVARQHIIYRHSIHRLQEQSE